MGLCGICEYEYGEAPPKKHIARNAFWLREIIIKLRREMAVNLSACQQNRNGLDLSV